MADSYTVDGVSGKTAYFTDVLDSTHRLVQATSADQVAVPTASALLGGRLAGVFTGAEFYVSNRSAASWKYLSDGTGFDLFAVFDPRGVLLTNTPYVVAATGRYPNNVTGNTLVWRTVNPTPGIGMRLKDVATVVIDQQSNTLTGFSAVGSYLEWSYKESDSPEWRMSYKSALQTSGASAAAPSSGNPDGPLTLASNATIEGSNAIMNWAALLVAPKVLSAAERLTTQAWIKAYYGIDP